MSQKFCILNEEKYQEEVRNYFSSILNGRLLSIDTNSATDEEIMSAITDYNVELGEHPNNCCTWLEIGDVISSNYNGHDYQYVNFISNEKQAFSINYSQFWYPMSPKEDSPVHFPVHNFSKANYVCTIDEKDVSPQIFFPRNKGSRIFLFYFFPAVTAYNKVKTCYLFEYQNSSPNKIRKCIYDAQLLVLKNLLNNPCQFAPITDVKVEFDNSSNFAPIINRNCICDITVEFVQDIFIDEFRQKVLDKFNLLNSR